MVDIISPAEARRISNQAKSQKDIYRYDQIIKKIGEEIRQAAKEGKFYIDYQEGIKDKHDMDNIINIMNYKGFVAINWAQDTFSYPYGIRVSWDIL